MELCERISCTGCLACYNACNKQAIVLNVDKEGFTYPLIDSTKCIECGLCRKACPVISEQEHKRLVEPVCYAAWSKDYELVRKSSSGGFFSTAAQSFIDSAGVVYGAAFNKELKVEHISINTTDGLERLRGSKYVQSDIGLSYRMARNDLNKGKKVLFSGTPCQIAGLNNFLGKEYDNLVTIDLVCHGVPSPLMFLEFKRYLEKKYNSKITYYSFRDKKWSWLHFNQKCIFENGNVYIGKWEESYFFQGFIRDLYSRKSCHKCKFANTHRPADITIADFWCYYGPRTEEQNKDRGVNAVILNTPKGLQLFNKIKSSLYYYSKPIERIKRTNEALSESFAPSRYRESFWSDYEEHGYEYVIDRYLQPKPKDKATQILYKYGNRAYRFYHTLLVLKSKINSIKYGK